MTPRSRPAFPTVTFLALAAASLLHAGCGEKRTPVAAPDRAAAPAQATPVEELATLLPDAGVDALSDDQRAVLARFLDQAFCHCGCPHTVSGCLRAHESCAHAKRMGWLAARLAAAGLPLAAVTRTTTDYYASFETAKRMKLDVEGWGPPLGNPEAPVTIVEFSDFTCPFCQGLRPQLEAWVTKNADRVKLVFKPFPIEHHAHAMEAAQAGEWARASGLFWPMHDAMFEQPQALAPDDLAGHARALGGDGDDLLKALEDGRFLDRIRRAKAEGRGAGMTGTPTLYVNGRRLILSDYSDAMLDHTLADEEEWQQHRGWAKD